MPALRATRLAEPAADPFGEKRRMALRMHAHILGGRFRFECDEPALLKIVREAYAKLPTHRLATPPPRFVVRLVLTSARPRAARGPPPVISLAGGGMLCGAMGDSSFVAINPKQGAALLVVNRDMLRFPYHLRYELLEFAVYTLAARAQRLVPLHAACVGLASAGVLLIGQSGSGKSTITLHCALAGLDFLAEDSVLVQPATLHATGVANFLHLRLNSLRFLEPAARASVLRRAAVIRRRSGVRKLEVDLRRPEFHLAMRPPRIRAIVFLSARASTSEPHLVPIPRSAVIGRLAASQRYAAHQPGWSAFSKHASVLPAYELRRGAHPHESAEALRELLRAR